MLVKYSSNNSGGHWWLGDQDWMNLEKAGWKVGWIKDESGDNRRKHKPDKNGEYRWLGALATDASKEFNSIKEALEEFERITDQRVSDEGCNCCGAPHSFNWDGGYISGSDCLSYLYDEVPGSLREACERLNK